MQDIAKEQLFPPRPYRLKGASNPEVELEVSRAQEWLDSILASHKTLLGKEREMRMFRSAVEKELAGATHSWTEMERLYMTLTNGPDATHGLKAAFILVLHLNLAESLGAMGKLAAQRHEVLQHKRNSEADATRVEIVENTRAIKVDHFACAVSLSSLQSRPDVIDDSEGCCPVCQNSYSDLATNTTQDLLSDFPVRIKHCGHIIGKACLERWMVTPKIDAAKYPHRTCPLCRVKIEGVQAPPVPTGLRDHMNMNRRANETLRELFYGWDMEVEECLDTIVACMSVEIACEEILAIIKRQKGKTRWGYEADENMLRDKMEQVNRQKWVWGFRGDRVWRQLRNEWMKSGIMRKD